MYRLLTGGLSIAPDFYQGWEINLKVIGAVLGFERERLKDTATETILSSANRKSF